MSVIEWYADREVLLTGVTSTLGRSLLEKILRSCPDIKVHAVLRSRHHYNKDDRIKRIFASPGFERLRQKYPDAISRVRALEGNLLYEGLGLSKEDRASLKKVSVAFHAAGPHDDVFDFCQELPELKVLAAASSVFRYRGQLTEALQNEQVPEIPLALVRFPILSPALVEPMPGFVEVLNGVTALMVGAGLALGHPENPAELLPVDLAANALIVTAWDRGTREKTDAPLVYNAPRLECTWGELIEKGHRANRKFAYPTFGVRGITSMAMLHWMAVLLLEWLPSVLCDMILNLGGGKQRILAEHVKVRTALRSLEPFLSKSLSVSRNRLERLRQRLGPEDREAFPMFPDIDIEAYVLCAAASTRKYCVDEKGRNLVRNFKRVFAVFLLVAVLFYFFF
ncbi:fatty acyl-CoA reductase 1 [Orussus abietinus]|uniref:fatty acyl-CoA reductase 1 n=1 Tax=Orussus abietinus TaxID=222816 RepID=UPI000625267E|nr:fatty acyl-CoA reductase 1 [Orussus abietinus]